MRYMLLLCAWLLPGVAQAQQIVDVGAGSASPPHGFVDFCRREPAECLVSDRGFAVVRATPDRIKLLQKVNDWVNSKIHGVTDKELYGVNEWWTVPATAGDCEDYAILKRHVLIEKYGWPASALRLTVVYDEDDLGHTVLTVVTSVGDYVLDNKHEWIGFLGEFQYKPLMRQSGASPRVWTAISIETATAQ